MGDQENKVLRVFEGAEHPQDHADEVRFRKFSLNSDISSEDKISDKIKTSPLKPKPALRKPGDKSKKPRKTLLLDGDKRGLPPSSDDSDAEGDLQEKNRKSCPCAKHLRSAFRKRLKKFNAVSATNLKIGSGAATGLWDTWGVYYCSSRFGRHSQFNANYFALISLFVMSQGSMLNLIYHMSQHGGCAFLVVLCMAYISVGYPMYVFETMMGQYSGRKPMAMLRHMLPAMTGIGPALYLRTVVKAVNALGTFIYCAYLAFGLFFCKPADNAIIYRFLDAEQRNKKFNLFSSLQPANKTAPARQEPQVYEFWWLIIFTIVLFVMVSQTLKLHGELNKVVVRVLLLAMGGYLIVGVSRIMDASSSSVVFKPLQTMFQPSWGEVFTGRAWLDAIIFVIQSMELGTLVHPYLGSKNFFHYRSYRDGLYLVLLALIWNLSATVAALAWLGYVGINPVQMKTSTDHLFGHYGLIVVFMLKHLQGEMTQKVQGDTLFFNAFFYSIVGAASLCALIVYIIIIVDCSYPESGQWILKMIIMTTIVLFFGLAVPVFVVQKEGLRCLIFINFYVHKSWSAFFITGCYFGAVAFGHDLGKFVHDFLNIIHIKGYQSRQHSYGIPRILRYFILTFLTMGMITYIFTRPYPHEGQTDWVGSDQYIGVAFSCVPLFALITVASYHYAKKGNMDTALVDG